MHSEESIKAANLARLEASELPALWIRKYRDGLDDSDWRDVLARVEGAGYWPIDIGKVRQLVSELRMEKPAQPKRTRSGGIPSIEHMQTPTTQADASWVDGEDFARRHLFKKGDFFFGRSAETMAPLGYDDERHILVICGSHSGKGTGIIIPNHLLWPGPLVSVDPKGENATVSAARRGDGNDVCFGMGQKVCVLDPMAVSHVEDKYRSRFNPLDEIDSDDPSGIDKAASIANSMIIRTGQETDDYWNNEARDALQALILHVKTASQFEGRRHLGTVRQLIMHGDEDAVRQLREQEGDEQKVPDAHKLLFSLMMENQSCNGLIRGRGKALLDMMIVGDKQWIGVRGAIQTNTSFLDNRHVESCLSSSDFRLSELKGSPNGMSIFMCLQERDMPTYSRWQRILLNLMAYELQGSREMPACGHRVLMCLDEFAGLEKMKEFERGISYFAGYKVRLLVVLQYVSQIKTTYEKNWEAFLGNSSLKVFFDLGEITTPEMLSKWLGEIELIRYAESRNSSLTAQRSLAANSGQSLTLGQSLQSGESDAVGGSESTSENHSISTNSSEGGNQTEQQGDSSGENSSFERNRWFFRNIQKPFGRLRDKETLALNKGHHRGLSKGTQWNHGTTVQHGGGRTQGSNWQRTRNIGTTENAGSTESSGLTGTTGESSTHAAGLQQNFQKRALISSTDIGKWFSRIKDKSNPYYPGLALAMVSAEDPAIIRRVDYFEDEICDGLYDRDPAHPESEPLPLMRTMAVQILGSTDERLALWADHEGVTYGPEIARWHKRVGEPVRKGEALLEIKPGPAFTPFSEAMIPVYAPVSGQLDHIHAGSGQAFKFGLVLGLIRYHKRHARDEDHIPVIEEVDAYNCGRHPAPYEYLHQREEHEKRIRDRLEEERLEKQREEEQAALDEKRRIEQEELDRLAEIERRQAELKEAEEEKRVQYERFQGQFSPAPIVLFVLLFIGCGVLVLGLLGKTEAPIGFLGIVGRLIMLAVLLALSVGFSGGTAFLADTFRKAALEKAWENREHEGDEPYWEEKGLRRKAFFFVDDDGFWTFAVTITFLTFWLMSAGVVYTTFSREEIIWYHGIALWVGGVVACVLLGGCLAVLNKLCRRAYWLYREGEWIGWSVKQHAPAEDDA